MSSAEELQNFIEDARRYFAQQEDLFGNIVYRDAREGSGQQLKQPMETKRFGAYPDEPWAKAESLSALGEQTQDCVKCPLGQTRTKFVFGTGNNAADVMFIGEAPGADEDLQGEPFVGRAGQLLNKIIESIGMKREEVYICNILKCRPPNNRDPEPSEMETCSPYLMKQIELMQPKFIICLGRISAQWLLRTNDSLGKLRGRFHDYNGIKLMVTYHPAALLRNQAWKRPTWEDMKMFKQAYDEMKLQ